MFGPRLGGLARARGRATRKRRTVRRTTRRAKVLSQPVFVY
jgi:hypothetical protein